MKLYNTLSRSLEPLQTLKEGEVKIYQCGPTVYWVQHIGNLRAMTAGDSVRRIFSYLDYKVKYVRNYTDFGHLVSDGDFGEDRMEKGSKREGLTPAQVAEKYIKIFDNDNKLLNNLDPDYSTKATDYIAEMIDIIQSLLGKGYAYLTPEAIYYDISKFDKYTELSGQKLENLLKGAGHGDDGSATAKRNPADFALWFFKTGSHANSSLTWESPFISSKVENGVGTPGWHVECSAMAMAKLGPSMDIHMGGVEHIPIHHTNEIAQSEAHTGKQFAKYWLHNEHLTINGAKMSKSDGNIYTLQDIIDKGYNPMHLRYLYHLTHYRSKQDFTWENLESAKTAYERLLKKIHILNTQADSENDIESSEGNLIEEYKQKFVEAISQDFNIPQALSIVWELLGDIKYSQNDKYITILDFDKVLGLKLKENSEQIGVKNSDKVELSDDVKKLLTLRLEARVNKDFVKSDQIRDQLAEMGYEVKDSAEGQVVTRSR